MRKKPPQNAEQSCVITNGPEHALRLRNSILPAKSEKHTTEPVEKRPVKNVPSGLKAGEGPEPAQPLPDPRITADKHNTQQHARSTL